MIESSVKDTHSETIELRKKLEHYQRDKCAMQKLQKRHDSLRKQMDNISMELDAKILHCDVITEERNELRQKFEEAILEVQQRSSMNFFFKCLNIFIDLFSFIRPSECHVRAETKFHGTGNRTA